MSVHQQHLPKAFFYKDRANSLLCLPPMVTRGTVVRMGAIVIMGAIVKMGSIVRMGAEPGKCSHDGRRCREPEMPWGGAAGAAGRPVVLSQRELRLRQQVPWGCAAEVAAAVAAAAAAADGQSGGRAG